MNCSFPFADDPVSANQDNNRELRENRRRRSRFISVSYTHLLSVRAANCLNNANITTVGQLAMKSESEMLKYRNFGDVYKRQVDGGGVLHQ